MGRRDLGRSHASQRNATQGGIILSFIHSFIQSINHSFTQTDRTIHVARSCAIAIAIAIAFANRFESIDLV